MTAAGVSPGRSLLHPMHNYFIPPVGGTAGIGFSFITCGGGIKVDGWPVKTGGAVYVIGTPYDGGGPLSIGPGAWCGGLTAIGPDGGERHSHSAGAAITGPLRTGEGAGV